MAPSVEQSYAACSEISRAAGSNFYYTFFLLPRSQRRAMHALYAYLRRTDDLADAPLPAAERRSALRDWRSQLAAALDDPNPSGELIWPALRDTVDRYEVPHDYLFNVIRGVEQDLEPRGYPSFRDLHEYCYRVASVVGLACIHIWGFNDRRALYVAEQCGIAFQLTNIIRDLVEDARAGRVYLPEDELAQFEYTRTDFREVMLAGAVDDRLRELVAWQMDRAESYYDRAAELPQFLHKSGRRIFGATFDTYHSLLSALRCRQDALFHERVRLPRWRRLQIVSRWFLPGSRRVKKLVAQPRPMGTAKS